MKKAMLCLLIVKVVFFVIIAINFASVL